MTVLVKGLYIKRFYNHRTLSPAVFRYNFYTVYVTYIRATVLFSFTFWRKK